MHDALYALILPYLNYCCTAWGGCSKTNLSKLQKLQNKYARLVLNADRFTSRCFLLTTLNWQSVEQIIRYQYCILTYKALNNLAPTYIQSMIKTRSFHYCTRYSLDSPLTVHTPGLITRSVRSATSGVPYLINFQLQCKLVPHLSSLKTNAKV